MRISRSLPLVLLVAWVAASEPAWATPGSVAWHQSYDSPANGYAGGKVLLPSHDGKHLYVAGYASSQDARANATVIQYAQATGTPGWKSSYDGPGHGSDMFFDAVLSPDGTRLYATGLSKGKGTDLDFVTVAISAKTGRRLWVARFAGPQQSDDRPEAIAIDPAGKRIYVVGYGSQIGGVVKAYSASTGDALWSWSNGYAWIFDVGVGAGGRVMIVGKVRSDEYAAAMSPRNGSILWSHRVDGTDSAYDVATHLALTPNGGTALMGGWVDNQTTNYDALVVAYSVRTGAKAWEYTYDQGNGPNRVSALAVSPDGARAFVGVGSYPLAGRLLSLPMAGGAPNWGVPSAPLGMAVGPGADITVLGSGGDSGRDYIATTYDAATGATGWTGTWVTSTGEPADIAVATDSSAVFVTGSADENVTTVAFSAI